jgi:hypothetical protein
LLVGHDARRLHVLRDAEQHPGLLRLLLISNRFPLHFDSPQRQHGHEDLLALRANLCAHFKTLVSLARKKFRHRSVTLCHGLRSG